jgi:HAE1 family hydrophobic/amphiphilic exporter-1
MATAAGAATPPLTLDQALTIALEKNRDIDKAREYGKYVQGRYVEERAAALPQLSLSASYRGSRDDGQPAVMGGKMAMYTGSAGVTFSQPLYTWGKIGAAIRAAEAGLLTADEELRTARQAAWRDVSVAFSDVLLQRELLRLATENLEQKKRHSDEAHKRFALGVATDYDVLAADVAVENARPETIRADNQLRIAREQLRFLLALEDDGVEVSGSLAVTPSPLPSYDQALGRALAKRPELAEQRHRIGMYNELVTIARADDKPRLDLKGGAGYGSLESTAFSASGPAWNLGVYLSFPFFDGFRTSGRVQQAESDLATRRIEERKLIDGISLEVRTALSNLREAEEILSALSGTVRQAERLLQMAEKGYEYGVKIRLEVEDAQLNLLQARSSLARASRDYRAARVNLAWAMGVAGEE